MTLKDFEDFCETTHEEHLDMMHFIDYLIDRGQLDEAFDVIKQYQQEKK